MGEAVANGESPQQTADAAPAGRGDEVEQALLEVRALIESTMAHHRDRFQRGRLVTPVEPGCGSLAETAAELMAEAGRSVDIVLSADPARAMPVLAELDLLLARGVHPEDGHPEDGQPEDGRLADGHAEEGEPKVRVLCTRATLDGVGPRSRLRTDPRVKVRVVALPPMEAVLVDGRVALASAEWPSGRLAAVIRAGAVIDALQALFLGVWGQAEALGDRIDLGDSVRADFARQILQRMHAGATDEAAARELAISVRTYRRYVAEIMGLLGANSRFQAGVRAAELGLLATEPRALPRVPPPRLPER